MSTVLFSLRHNENNTSYVVSTTNNQVVNLLVNDDFINFVVNPNLALCEMWEEFFSLHPEIIPHAIEAKRILLGEEISQQLPAHEMKSLELEIFSKCGLSPVA